MIRAATARTALTFVVNEKNISGGPTEVETAAG